MSAIPGQGFATPAAAEAAFYAAFAAVDREAMEAVWAPGEHTLCIHPGGGLRRGRQAVIQSWMEIFSGTSPPSIQHRLIASFETRGLAVRLVEELIRPHGAPPEAATRVLATNVFIREGGSWRIVEHHASLPLVPPRGGDEDERRLH